MFNFFKSKFHKLRSKPHTWAAQIEREARDAALGLQSEPLGLPRPRIRFSESTAPPAPLPPADLSAEERAALAALPLPDFADDLPHHTSNAQVAIYLSGVITHTPPTYDYPSTTPTPDSASVWRVPTPHPMPRRIDYASSRAWSEAFDEWASAAEAAVHYWSGAPSSNESIEQGTNAASLATTRDSPLPCLHRRCALSRHPTPPDIDNGLPGVQTSVSNASVSTESGPRLQPGQETPVPVPSSAILPPDNPSERTDRPPHSYSDFEGKMEAWERYKDEEEDGILRRILNQYEDGTLPSDEQDLHREQARHIQEYEAERRRERGEMRAALEAQYLLQRLEARQREREEEGRKREAHYAQWREKLAARAAEAAFTTVKGVTARRRAHSLPTSSARLHCTTSSSNSRATSIPSTLSHGSSHARSSSTLSPTSRIVSSRSRTAHSTAVSSTSSPRSTPATSPSSTTTDPTLRVPHPYAPSDPASRPVTPGLGALARAPPGELEPRTRPHPLAIYTDEEWAALPSGHRTLARKAYPEIRRRRRERALSTDVAFAGFWKARPHTDAARLARRERILRLPLAQLAWWSDDVWAQMRDDDLAVVEEMAGQVTALRDAEEVREGTERARWKQEVARLRTLLPGSREWVEGMVGAPLEGETWAALGADDVRLEALLRERIAGERRRRKRWRFRCRSPHVPPMHTLGSSPWAFKRYTLVDEGVVPRPKEEREPSREPPHVLERGSVFKGHRS